MPVERFTLDNGQYTVNFTNGKTVKCAALTSEGKPRREQDGGHFDHEIHYSDGTIKKSVLSSRIAVIPDCSLLD